MEFLSTYKYDNLFIYNNIFVKYRILSVSIRTKFCARYCTSMYVANLYRENLFS